MGGIRTRVRFDRVAFASFARGRGPSARSVDDHGKLCQESRSCNEEIDRRFCDDDNTSTTRSRGPISRKVRRFKPD